MYSSKAQKLRNIRAKKKKHEKLAMKLELGLVDSVVLRRVEKRELTRGRIKEHVRQGQVSYFVRVSIRAFLTFSIEQVRHAENGILSRAKSRLTR